MNKSFYPVVVVELTADDGGGFMAFAPDLKGCMSPGDSPEEALQNARQAVVEWITEAKAAGRAIPAPESNAKAAVEARAKLVQKVKDQDEAIDSLDRDIGILRAAVKVISDRMRDDAPVWGASIPLLVAHAEVSNEDSVH